MRRKREPLWKSRGFKKCLGDGFILWKGGRFRGQKGIYRGHVKCLAGEVRKNYEFVGFMKNPPSPVKKHPDSNCVGSIEDGWWFLHWPTARGVDQVIANTEAIIDERDGKRFSNENSRDPGSVIRSLLLD